PTYNDINTKEWYGGEDRKDAESGRPLPRVYKLEDEGFDPVVHEPSEIEKKTTQALEKALEWGDRIPIGVFFKNEHVPTFEERILQRVSTYMDNPPALQSIAGPNGEPRTDLTRTPWAAFSTRFGRNAPRIRPGLFVVPIPMISRDAIAYIRRSRSRTFLRP